MVHSLVTTFCSLFQIHKLNTSWLHPNIPLHITLSCIFCILYFVFVSLFRALKRDVTRLGKRTKQGAFDDGVNSALRYFINNYQDVNRQRGIDILLGFVSADGIETSVSHCQNHGFSDSVFVCFFCVF